MLKKLVSLTIISLLMTAASHSFAQPQVEVELVGSFGSFGKNTPGTFDWPVGIAIDDQGRLIIADNENHRIQRCSIEGNCEVFGKRGAQLGEFVWPLGVAVDSLGRIIVSEAGNDRIQLRSPGGDWTSFGSTGRVLSGEFRLPAGIAVDDQDRIIIADQKNHRIQICNDTGTCSAFGSQGTALGMFDTPRAVAVTSQGLILVADFWNHRIQICSYEGECTAIGSLGTAPGQLFHPSGVTVDSQDRVIISDGGNNRFQICDLSGACVAFGEIGSGPGQFRNPQAIAVDDQNRIFVADVVSQNIQIFQATYTDVPGSLLINPGLNDAWYNPDTTGQGFFITVFPDLGKVSLAWFTYDTEPPHIGAVANLGDAGHRWLTALGSFVDNQAVMNISIASGGLFDTATEIQSTEPPGSDGTIILTFDSCNSGTVEYDIPSISRQGIVPIRRVADDNIVICEALSTN
jgi:sugar lactone lactonase YvrE